MNLHIKNDEAHQLANELAEALLALGDRYATLPDRDTRSADDILGYDECGLPT